MALGAAAVGALAAIGVLKASLQWNTPTGPSIVAVAMTLFAVGVVMAALVRGAGWVRGPY